MATQILAFANNVSLILGTAAGTGIMTGGDGRMDYSELNVGQGLVYVQDEWNTTKPI